MRISARMEKMVNGGQCLGRTGAKVIFAWNALPDEIVEINLQKNKKDFAEGVAVSWSNLSPHRIDPREDHFLICSPWQMMDYSAENKWKVEISTETFRRISGMEMAKEIEISAPQEPFAYRNKIEYGFVKVKDKISLSFFGRGQHLRFPITGCLLATATINDTATIILEWINQNKIPIRSLKSLIIRSNTKGETIAALFVKDKLYFDKYPALLQNWLGFQLYYSDHRCPASRPDEMLYSTGQDYLLENLQSRVLRYGLLSFFQVNVPIFISVLKDIGGFIDLNDSLVDYYAGVGVIGIVLSDKAKRVVMVESNAKAVEYAKTNIITNGLENKCEVVLRPVEKITDLIEVDKTIIFDPPRSGLHKDVVRRVLEKLPKRLVYLSCNVATQARDIKILSGKYRIKFLQLYNFFPRTPHVESLCILEKNN